MPSSSQCTMSTAINVAAACRKEQARRWRRLEHQRENPARRMVIARRGFHCGFGSVQLKPSTSSACSSSTFSQMDQRALSKGRVRQHVLQCTRCTVQLLNVLFKHSCVQARFYKVFVDLIRLRERDDVISRPHVSGKRGQQTTCAIYQHSRATPGKGGLISVLASIVSRPLCLL